MYRKCHHEEGIAAKGIFSTTSRAESTNMRMRNGRQKTLNIYTDSRYAWGILHDSAAIWALRGFKTSSGKVIRHGDLIKRLIQAAQEPRQIAVIKCKAHTGGKNDVSKGNNRADLVAIAVLDEEEANPQPSAEMYVEQMVDGPQTQEQLKDLQASATMEEQESWRVKEGAKQNTHGVWVDARSRPFVPRKLLP